MILPFYPFYWSDYRAKTAGLTMAQHGAYIKLLEHYYCTGRRVPAKQCYSIALAMLEQDRSDVDVVLQLFFVREGDHYYMPRAEEVVAEWNAKHEKRVKAGKMPKRQSNAEAMPEQSSSNAEALLPVMPKQPEPEPSKIDSGVLRTPEGVARELAEVVVHWNCLKAAGLSPVIGKTLNPTRKAAVINRLKDLDGMPGWIALCDKIRASSFLCGNNNTGWKATFDWVLKPVNMTKILEGNYDDKSPATGTAKRPSNLDNIKLVTDAIDAEAARARRAAEAFGGEGLRGEDGDGDPVALPGLRQDVA